MAILRAALLAALIVEVSGCSKDKANPITSPSGLDPFTQNTRLGRGMNIGNALEAPMSFPLPSCNEWMG